MEQKLKIVIADDSTEFGANCANVLKSYGMDVSLCEKDGQKLLHKIKIQKPDVVIADVFMPNLDILGVLNAMREMPKNEVPMILAMSSFDNPCLEKETLSAGADGDRNYSSNRRSGSY